MYKPRKCKEYCNDIHYRPCPICGKPVEVKRGTFSDPPRTCSKACWRKLKDTTCLKTYGCVDPGNSAQAIQRRKETCLERYGVENPATLQACKDKARDTLIKNYGVDTPNARS